MSSFVKGIFGGRDNSAQKAQLQQNAHSRALIARNARAARSDLLKLFPSAMRASRAGSQAALNLLAQTIPQQLQTFRDGNVAAQAALLGGVTRPQSVQYNSAFARQTLPNFETAGQALASPTTHNLSPFLGGRYFFPRFRF